MPDKDAAFYLREAEAHLSAADADPRNPFAQGRLLAAIANATIAAAKFLQPGDTQPVWGDVRPGSEGGST